MSFSKVIPSLVLAALAVGITAPPARAQLNLGSGVVINDIDLEGLAYDAASGVLSATGGTVTGTIAGFPFVTEIDEFSLQLEPEGDEMGACSILHLELAPIDIDLLGLHVDTSAICLNITAFEGEGLLGDLLCSVAGGNLLQLDELLDALAGILGSAMTEDVGPAQGGGGAEDICDGDCEILDLALGPVDLTLLGLNVLLDDCDDGPVQVCVSASAGEGLLGDLLCGLTGGGGGILPDLGNLEDLVDAISGILDQLDGLDARPQDVNRLVKQLGKALEDGALSDKELDKLTKAITKLVG